VIPGNLFTAACFGSPLPFFQWMVNIWKSSLQQAVQFRKDAILLLVLGIGLILLGARQFVPALYLLGDGEILGATQQTRSESAGSLAQLIADETSALSLRETATGWSDLGQALMQQAAAHGAPPALVHEARQALITSLALAPAEPYVWTRLAIADQLLDIPTDRKVADWRMAYMTGPNELSLQALRMQLAIPLWPDLSNDDHEAVFADILGGWRKDPNSVLSAARDTFSTNIIRAALVRDIPELVKFDRLLRDRAKK